MENENHTGGMGKLGGYNSPMNTRTAGSLDRVDRKETQTELIISEIHATISTIERELEIVLSPDSPMPVSDRPVNNTIQSRLSDVYERLSALKNRINL